MNFDIDILRNILIYTLRLGSHNFSQISNYLNIPDNTIIQYLERRSEVGWSDLTETQLTTLKNIVIEHFNLDATNPLRVNDDLLTEFTTSTIHLGLRMICTQNYLVSNNTDVLCLYR